MGICNKIADNTEGGIFYVYFFRDPKTQKPLELYKVEEK